MGQARRGEDGGGRREGGRWTDIGGSAQRGGAGRLRRGPSPLLGRQWGRYVTPGASTRPLHPPRRPRTPRSRFRPVPASRPPSLVLDRIIVVHTEYSTATYANPTPMISPTLWLTAAPLPPSAPDRLRRLYYQCQLLPLLLRSVQPSTTQPQLHSNARTSSVIGFPSKTEAKPHCGLIESLCIAQSAPGCPFPQRQIYALSQRVGGSALWLALGYNFRGAFHARFDLLQALELPHQGRLAAETPDSFKGLVPFRSSS